MTKQEVYNNIAYNERLVSDYRNKINYLNTQIEKLYALLRKYEKLQSELENRQRNRIHNLNKFCNMKISISLAKSYYESMKNLLNGLEYRNTINGLKQAQDKIAGQIRLLQNEVGQNRGDLQYREKRIQYWREQLQYAQDY